MGRRLGQHFLHDASVAQRIVQLAAIGPDDQVLEIGGGRGALTEHLAELGARRVVVELDDALADLLATRYGARIELVRADVLDVALADLGGARRWVVLGNLPYYATSPILLWLCRQWRCVDRALVMMQAEVAQRLTAVPRTKEYGRLTLATALRARAATVLRVKPGSFSPPPAVLSAVVRLAFRAEPAEDVGDDARFEGLVAAGFRYRRKTVAAAMALGLPASLAMADGWLTAAGIAARARAEDLTLADWARLARVVQSDGQEAGP